MNIEELKYPVGKYQKTENISQEILKEWTSIIEAFPALLKKEVNHLSNEQLDTPYREGGWTIRQVVHHCADSHMNSLVRLKLALTEDKPIIKTYHEELWAELADGKTLPLGSSLAILEGLHSRWTVLLKSMSESDFSRCFIHPAHGNEVRLDHNLGIYEWHCRHHLAHITTLKKRMAWK